MAFTPFTKDDRPTMANFNEKFLQVLDEDVKMEVGEYDGTGTYGSDAPTEINLSFKPALVIIMRKGDVKASESLSSYPGHWGVDFVVLADGSTNIFRHSSGRVTLNVKFSEGLASFYSAGSVNPASALAQYQFNATGTRYTYIAFGE